MAKVELKKPVVDEIAGVIQDADSVVLVNYSGLTVEQDTALRKSLRENGVIYKVYKNTMMNFAFRGTPCEELCKDLEGTNALAVSKEDATAPARLIGEFAKKNPQIEFVSGVVEGNYYDVEGLKALAKIPAREVLLSRLLGSLQSPIANLARVLNQIAEKGGGEAAAAEAPASEEAASAEAPAAEEAAPAETPAAEEKPAE
ncbi:MAG: 50S ribosomal protein L10 [Bilifractor sp.]|jgi:large subunit ribosomal protein L10